MLFAVLFEDDPSAPSDIRQTHMPAHLHFLESHPDIRAAGPLVEASAEGAGAPAGGLWLVEAESAVTVDALVRADPFWPTGLRKCVRVLAWRQVFADGRRLSGTSAEGVAFDGA